MSFDLKGEVLRELRAAYCAKDNYTVEVGTHDWKQTLVPLLKTIITKAQPPTGSRRGLALSPGLLFEETI